MKRRIEVLVDVEENLFLSDDDFERLRQRLENTAWLLVGLHMRPGDQRYPDVFCQANEVRSPDESTRRRKYEDPFYDFTPINKERQ